MCFVVGWSLKPGCRFGIIGDPVKYIEVLDLYNDQNLSSYSSKLLLAFKIEMAQDSSSVNSAYTEKLEQWKTEFDTMFTTFIEQLKPAERLRSEDPSTIPIENLGDEIDKIEADIDSYTSTHKTLQFTNIIEHISDVFTRFEKIDVEHSETRQAAKREKIERLNRARKALEDKIHSLPVNDCPDCDK